MSLCSRRWAVGANAFAEGRRALRVRCRRARGVHGLEVTWWAEVSKLAIDESEFFRLDSFGLGHVLFTLEGMISAHFFPIGHIHATGWTAVVEVIVVAVNEGFDCARLVEHSLDLCVV
eukprot:309349-Pleurochrysis_carterae.AAC.2